jgi:hypothetical protein
MAYALLPALVTPQAVEVYKNFLSPAASAVVSDILGRAEAVKQNPGGSSPGGTKPASATFGVGGTSFFA